MLTSGYHCKENDRTIWFPGRIRTPRTQRWLWCSWSRGHCLCSPMSPGCTDTTWNPSFSLKWKCDKSTKHYSLKCCLPSSDTIDRQEKFTCMKVQGCLMQACFIEIHQVFAKKNVCYSCKRVVYKQVAWIWEWKLGWLLPQTVKRSVPHLVGRNGKYKTVSL